ncbi:MAG: hypothetical protein WCK10_04125, partial [Candidatus Staskawiczbacteria bacterium]
MYRVKLLSAISSLTILSLAMPMSAEQLDSPDWDPPFEIKQNQRQAPVLAVKNFIDRDQKNQSADAASLEAGNKRISVREADNNQFTSKRDNEVAIFVNNKPVFNIVFGGSAQGYKAEDVKLVSDQASNTIRWLRSYSLPGGAQGTFSYQLKPIGGSQVELSWEPGCTDEQADKIKNCPFYFAMPEAYRKAGVEINGALLKPQSDDALKQADQKGIAAWQGKLEKLVYNPGNPLDGVTILFSDPPQATCTEKYAYEKYSMGFQMGAKLPGKLIIDLGEAAVARQDAPPAVEGNDLWAQDALHLPKTPTRNLFPNPSFEQGMRYWRWMGGGAHYTRSDVLRYATDNTAGLFGKSALVVNPTQQASAGLISFSLPGKKGQTYTVSFYAKAEKDGAGACLGLFSTKS